MDFKKLFFFTQIQKKTSLSSLHIVSLEELPQPKMHEISAGLVINSNFFKKYEHTFELIGTAAVTFTVAYLLFGKKKLYNPNHHFEMELGLNANAYVKKSDIVAFDPSLHIERSRAIELQDGESHDDYIRKKDVVIFNADLHISKAQHGSCIPENDPRVLKNGLTMQDVIAIKDPRVLDEGGDKALHSNNACVPITFHLALCNNLTGIIDQLRGEKAGWEKEKTLAETRLKEVSNEKDQINKKCNCIISAFEDKIQNMMRQQSKKEENIIKNFKKTQREKMQCGIF